MPNTPGDKLSAELTKICPDIPILICTDSIVKLNLLNTGGNHINEVFN